jgi:hypothetical protein
MIQMTSRILRAIVLAGFVLTTGVPASFGASADKKPSAEGDAQLIDHAEYACSDCFFGTSDQFFCFRVDNRILIGDQHVPTVNYSDPDKNYLTKYHKSWTKWQAPGTTVHVKYNDKFIWLPNPTAGKKDIRLTQKYTTDIFLNDGPCRQAIHVPSN